MTVAAMAYHHPMSSGRELWVDYQSLEGPVPKLSEGLRSRLAQDVRKSTHHEAAEGSTRQGVERGTGFRGRSQSSNGDR